MEHILSKFTIYLRSMDYSEQTIKSYKDDLRLFFNFIKQYLRLEQINIFTLGTVKEEDIIAFLIYLNYKRNNAPETRNRRLATIKSFYRWAFDFYHSAFREKENPAVNIPTIQKVQRLPRCLNLKQAKGIQSIFNISNSCNYIRDNTIITLFLNTGIRLASLINANISDLNFDNATLLIKIKGNKEQTVYLNKITVIKLKEYLNTRNDNNDSLFISNRMQRISRKAVQNICKKALALIGINEDHYSVHTLRHTAASIIYQNTGDILIVKEFLGHESIASTEIYAHIYSRSVKNAVDSNPLSNFDLELKNKRKGKRVLT